MKKFPELVKAPFKFGLYGGLLVIILIITLYYLNRHPLLIPIVFDFRMLLLPLFVYLSVKEFRDHGNEKILHFWQGIAGGFVCYSVIGFIASLFIFFFSWIIEPGFLKEFIEASHNQLTANREQFLKAIGEEAFQNTLDNLPFTRPIHLALDYFFKTMMIGILFTIIISVILRRSPKL